MRARTVRERVLVWERACRYATLRHCRQQCEIRPSYVDTLQCHFDGDNRQLYSRHYCKSIIPSVIDTLANPKIRLNSVKRMMNIQNTS